VKDICGTILAILAVLGLLAFTATAFANITDEKVIVQQDVMFSTPADLTGQQKTAAYQKGNSSFGGAGVIFGRDNNVHHSPDSLAVSSTDLCNEVSPI
jgi:hypothetical protein